MRRSADTAPHRVLAARAPDRAGSAAARRRDRDQPSADDEGDGRDLLLRATSAPRRNYLPLRGRSMPLRHGALRNRADRGRTRATAPDRRREAGRGKWGNSWMDNFQTEQLFDRIEIT